MSFFFFFSTLLIAATQVSAEPRLEPLTLKIVLERGLSNSPVLRIAELDQRALVTSSRTSYGNLLPEVGVEGGARSSREKEKRNDHFYYGYGKWALSFQSIQELRAQLAKINLAERNRKQIRIQLKAELARMFFDTLQLQRQIDFKQEDYSLAEKQMGAARKRVDAGVATSTDLLEFQLHQQEIENDLLDMKQELRTSVSQLCRLIGIAETSHNSVAGEFLKEFKGPVLDEASQKLKGNSIELAAAEASAKTAKAEKLAALGAWLPRFTAEAQYGKLMETDFIESRKDSWEVIGKVTIPLFQGFQSYNQYQNKSAESERAQIQLQMKSHELDTRLKQMTDRLSSLNEKVKGELKNVEVGRKYFDAVMGEYRRGVKNSPDLAGATDKLFEARSRLLSTQKELTNTRMDLAILQGEDWEF